MCKNATKAKIIAKGKNIRKRKKEKIQVWILIPFKIMQKKLTKSKTH